MKVAVRLKMPRQCVCVSVFLSVRPSLSVCVSVFYLSTDPSQTPTYAGTILQRFPVTDRKTTPLPRGIEIFCQPLGWSRTTTPSPPSLTTFILTAEDGKRLFCSSLTFYQLESQNKRAKKRMLSAPAEQDVSSIAEACQIARFRSSPSFDCLDEALEANWSPEAIVNNPHEMFIPVSFCLVSRLPLFDILQSCLKGLYLNWLIGLLATRRNCRPFPNFLHPPSTQLSTNHETHWSTR
ncbi:Myotubularin-related protein 13 [Geodia barretti]|uniref:Myotubularin-related protein 13 n=1 Tax=Geodia barretti TaxID=519541 RepID=A0AA35TTU6_GEOBA|nr:Myotubularin-related protein 13 [Geodia barretti]